MNLPGRLACFLLIALPLLPLAAAAQNVEYQVVIEAPAEVKSLLADNLALIRWRGNERIDREQLQRLFVDARGDIEKILATEGFYTPHIESTLEPSGAGFVARFRIEPGEVARVAEVTLEFAGAILARQKDEQPDMETLRANWMLSAGEPFRHAAWEAAKRKLIQDLIIYRYPLAALIDSRAEVDVKTGRANLHVKIDSGPAVRFGELTITGLKRYPTHTVTRLNPIESGQVYSQTQLLELQRRLQDVGFFQRADVSAEVGDVVATGVAPVRVDVEEFPAHRITLGAGYSTNTGYRGQVNHEWLNFLSSAVRLKSAVVLETKKQSGTVDFILPLDEKGRRDSISSIYKREDVQNETTRTAGTSATRTWGKPALERSVSLTYSRERKDVLGDTGFETAFSQTLAANYVLTLRRTDNLLSPTQGYLLTGQVGGAPLRFLTTTSFGRVYGKYAGYFPIGESNTAILRAELGAIGARGRIGIPTDSLFRAGGDQSIRGYGYQALGVHEGAAVVGGRYLAVGSAEVVHWLKTYPGWGVAAFVDGGNAADRPVDLKPVYGYGLGARWKSPVGVLNLDVAYGQDVKKTRLHFSLGVTF